MRILLIVEPDRKDWYNYLKQDESNEYELLWYESKVDIPSWLLNDQFFKRVYYWDEFSTPTQLIKKIKPDRIVFFEIIDQRQIALMVTANTKGQKTFYLEHGAAGNKETALLRAEEHAYFMKIKSRYILKRMKGSLVKMLKSKLFYYSAIRHVSSLDSFIKYLRLPLWMLFKTPNKALSQNIFPERIPFRSIVFNRPNFEQFQVYTGIKEEKAIMSGIPMFDSYYSRNEIEQNIITYIDHPYFEEGLLGWTASHHRCIADILYDFAINHKIKILVKLHPRSDFHLWESYGFESQYFEIVQNGDYSKTLLESKLIMAFSSSMVNGLLCARKNVVLLGWHPQPGIFGADFSKTGLCHLSLDPKDLETKFNYWVENNLSIKNLELYNSFLKEFNYPFDGKATQRVIRAITSNEIS